MFNKKIKKLQNTIKELEKENKVYTTSMNHVHSKLLYLEAPKCQNVELKKEIELLKSKLEILEYQNKVYKEILEIK